MFCSLAVVARDPVGLGHVVAINFIFECSINKVNNFSNPNHDPMSKHLGLKKMTDEASRPLLSACWGELRFTDRNLTLIRL